PLDDPSQSGLIIGFSLWAVEMGDVESLPRSCMHNEAENREDSREKGEEPCRGVV
ncbi:hypothetical protein HAX54_025854, partial [Datura stramonium]|nr:hypothetical protein [Datura stramonium]